jgi:tRNA-binding EMAP/Myf-like protein
LYTIIEYVESSLNVKTEKKEVKKKEVKQVLQKKDENDERFEKAFIQVSKIVEAETLNDKLLKLTISKFFILYIFKGVGKEKNDRTILAGISKSYKKEELINKLIVTILNLKQRQMKVDGKEYTSEVFLFINKKRECYLQQVMTILQKKILFLYSSHRMAQKLEMLFFWKEEAKHLQISQKYVTLINGQK